MGEVYAKDARKRELRRDRRCHRRVYAEEAERLGEPATQTAKLRVVPMGIHQGQARRMACPKSWGVHQAMTRCWSRTTATMATRSAAMTLVELPRLVRSAVRKTPSIPE